MKIIYIGSFRFPIYDAAASRVLNNARALKLYGHEVKFISWGGNYNNQDKSDDNRFYYDGFEYVISNDLDIKGGLWEKVKGHLLRGRNSLNLIENEVASSDILISYNAEYHFTKKLQKIARKNKKKYVNDITEWYSSNDLYFIDRLSNILNMRCLQHRVKNKIVISRYLNEYYKSTNNIVIPPLCDGQEDKWIHENLKGIPESIKQFNGLRIIYAGNPGKKDSLHTVINVIERLLDEGANIQFLILGMSKLNYLDKYSHFLDNQYINGRIVFLGKVSQTDVPNYYKISDFMILLRDKTRKNMAGFPTKFVESMTSGVPVIANITSDIEFYLHDSVNGFILSENGFNDLYKTIKERVLKADPLEIRRMKDQAKLKGSEYFDFRSYSEEFNSFICNLR